MSKCACCDTPQGPFVGDRDYPGLRVCGYPPRQRAEGNTVVNPHDPGHKQYTKQAVRVRECLKRRSTLDAKRYPAVDVG